MELWALWMALKPLSFQYSDPAVFGRFVGGRTEDAVVVVDAGSPQQH